MTTGCNGCGACCRKYPLFASKADAEREPRIRKEALELPERVQDESRTYELHRLPSREECIFFDRNNRCMIYATRPAMCRRCIPSRKACQEARARLAGPLNDESEIAQNGAYTH
jgi:Fe-S-cluster containining protein